MSLKVDELLVYKYRNLEVTIVSVHAADEIYQFFRLQVCKSLALWDTIVVGLISQRSWLLDSVYNYRIFVKSTLSILDNLFLGEASTDVPFTTIVTCIVIAKTVVRATNLYRPNEWSELGIMGLWNPWTDWFKTCYGWLRRQCHPPC